MSSQPPQLPRQLISNTLSAPSSNVAYAIATFHASMDKLLAHITDLVSLQRRRQEQEIYHFSDTEGCRLQTTMRHAGKWFDKRRADLYAVLEEDRGREVLSPRFQEVMDLVLGLEDDGNLLWEWFLGWKHELVKGGYLDT